MSTSAGGARIALAVRGTGRARFVPADDPDERTWEPWATTPSTE